MKALIIIPAYNEEANIERTVKDLQEYCKEYDYLIINDGSTDKTEEICKRNGFSYVSLPINLGFSGAVQTGYKYAAEHGYDVAAQFDADGQHPAEKLPGMIQIVTNKNADYVIGSRFLSVKKPRSLRMFGSRLIAIAIFLRTGKRIKDPTSGMRVVNREILVNFSRNLNFIAEPDTLARVILSGYVVREYSIEILNRIGGVSHFSNPFNQIRYMGRMLISILFFQKRGW